MPNLVSASALQIFAGPRVHARLREVGLRAGDIRVVADSAGGPTGLVLNLLDRFPLGHWLKGVAQPVRLLGALIGAWRMAAACLDVADAASAEMAEDYIVLRYAYAPGKPPKASHVSEVFGAMLRRRFDVHASRLLTRGARRCISSRVGVAALWRAKGEFELRREHLDYEGMQDGLALIPHFQPRLVPGWRDKLLKHRHRPSGRLDDVVALAQRDDWVRTLPGAKLSDRGDFKSFGDDLDGRMRAWRRALAEGQRLADEFEAMVGRNSIAAEPLA